MSPGEDLQVLVVTTSNHTTDRDSSRDAGLQHVDAEEALGCLILVILCLTVTPTPHLAGLGPPVGVEAEDAGGEDAELEEDDCCTWSRCGR